MADNGAGGQDLEFNTSESQNSIEQLVDLITAALPQDGTVEPLEGVRLNRSSVPSEPLHGVSQAAFCVIAQGSKHVYLGNTRYQYDPGHYLLATAELPIIGQVVEASPERPYLSLTLDLDLVLIASVMIEAGHIPPQNRPAKTAIDVSLLDSGLLDAVTRLVRLVGSPINARFLAPLTKREIVYRLLAGEQGDRLRDIAVQDGHTHRIIEALERIRADLRRPLEIENLAQDLGMSVSSFYQHFRDVTAMSPLQFQKRLRLQEARRLMIGEHLDAATAGYQVGYDDASHFSREYRRCFGLPPLRDAERLREQTLNGTGSV